VPELPDIVVYIEALESRILNQPLERVRVASPFLLRTATPPLEMTQGKRVRELRRLGKRIAIGLQDELWVVLHLMIAGRLHWSKPKRARSAVRHSTSFKAKTVCSNSIRVDSKFSPLTFVTSRRA
jgi:formamidopyrimidine-DNA glycosylase